MNGRPGMGGRPLLLLLLPLLGACGFHLRGDVSLPAWLERVQVTGEPRYGKTIEMLAHSLRAAGATLVERPAQGDVVIVVEGEQRQRRVLSVNSEGRPREYELSYRLVYSVRTPAGRVLLPSRSVVRTKEYTFDEADVLGKSTEREELWHELRRRVVAAVVNRLRYSRRKPR